jgi:hypothetical protein
MEEILKQLEEKKDSIKDYEKLKRHLGSKIKVNFKNEEGQEDDFEFIPANYELYSKFMALAPAIEKGVDKEALEASMDLLVTVVKQSYPDWPDEAAKQFVATNFDGMMDVLEKLMPKTKRDVKDLKKIQQQLKFIGQGDKHEPGANRPDQEKTVHPEK